MRLTLIFLGLTTAALAMAEDRPLWKLDIEGLATGMSKNDVAIPGDSGTRFAMKDLTGRGAFYAPRVTLVWNKSGGSEWRLMLQPFSFSGTGQLSSATQFEGFGFAPGVDTKGKYRFNSYRISYRNTWKKTDRSHWKIGGTLKIRDAEIALEQGGVKRSKKDLGVVPLLHIYGEEMLGGPWGVAVDFDGAWAPQGRAIDLGVQLFYTLSDRSRATLGFRVLEGGADNDKVYNFSQFNSLTLGWQVRF